MEIIQQNMVEDMNKLIDKVEDLDVEAMADEFLAIIKVINSNVEIDQIT